MSFGFASSHLKPTSRVDCLVHDQVGIRHLTKQRWRYSLGLLISSHVIWMLPVLLLLTGCGSSVDVEQVAVPGRQAVSETEAGDNSERTVEEVVSSEPEGAAEEGAVGKEMSWGHLKGKIKVVGKPRAIPPVAIPAKPVNCQRGPVPQNKLIIGKNGGIRDVFVMMYLKRGAEKPAVHPSYAKAMLKSVDLDNKNCVFTPHALFVRVGQKLNVINSDKVGHNCHGKLFNNEFNFMIPGGETVEITLNENEKVPGDVVCDIHPWMNAVMLVREDPYATITDASGNFEIQNIPAGEWQFQFWHKEAGYMKELELAGFEFGRRGETQLEIKDGETLDLGTLEISVEALE